MNQEKEHATLIIGYLQNRLRGQDLDEFYAWVNESADNKRLFFEVKAVYDACKPLRTDAEVQASWQRLLEKRKSVRPFRNFSLIKRISTYAAIAIIAIAVTTVYFYTVADRETVVTRYVGGDGLEADVVVLPDGTRVSLGSRTSFSYDSHYGKNNRVVYLEGEAYFEVAKDKNKPFIVETKEQSIEALGTKFNVTAYPEDSLLVTTLLEGAVRLTNHTTSGATVLQPDEQLIYNKNTQSMLQQRVDAAQYASWTTGYYYFPEQSLEAILYRLSHVYGVRFTVQSEALNRRMFTGTFYRGQSMKEIMEIIRLAIPIRYEIDDHHVIIAEK